MATATSDISDRTSGSAALVVDEPLADGLVLLAVVAEVVASAWFALVVTELLAVAEAEAFAIGDIVTLAVVEVVVLTFGDVELLV